jgi:hypothetical protein
MYAVAAPLRKGARRLACSCPSTGLSFLHPHTPRARAWKSGPRLGAAITFPTPRYRAIAVPLSTARITPPGPSPVIGPAPIVRSPAWGSGLTTGTSANWGNGRSGWWNRQQNTQGLNPAGGPTSIVDSYDASGNPVYSVPPPGAVITGYDAQGNPIYNAQQSYTPATQQALIAQNEALLQAAQAGAVSSAAPAAAAPVATDSSGYSDVLDWLSENTLISAVPNWVVAGGAGLAALWLMNRGKR